MLTELLEHTNTSIASRLGPAQPRDVTWAGAGFWLVAPQSWQVNFPRTCCITFQRRGITSSVSVTSSPSLRGRAPPQHRPLTGAASTTRSRGRCSGKGRCYGGLREKAATLVVRAAPCSAAISSWVAAVSACSSPSFICSISRCNVVYDASPERICPSSDCLVRAFCRMPYLFV